MIPSLANHGIKRNNCQQISCSRFGFCLKAASSVWRSTGQARVSYFELIRPHAAAGGKIKAAKNRKVFARFSIFRF